MANTTNFGWETPDDTDLVKDGAAAIRTLGSAIDTSLADLEGGTTGQILAKNSNTDMDFIWVTTDDANAIQNAIVDAKGDIVAASANDTPARLAVGTDNHRLVAASGETTGLKYVADTQNTVIDAEGDLLVGDAADAVQRLAVGTTGQVLTVDTAVDGKIKWAAPASGALVLISTSSPSAVSSQTMDDVFSSTYDNYLIKINLTASAQNTLGYYLRVGGSDTTSNYQRQLIIGASTTLTGERASDNGIGALNSGGKNFTAIQIFDPNKANYTGAISSSIREDSGNIGEFLWTSYQKDSTQFTGIKFLTGSGTITGTISIYGLAK